MIGCSKNNGEIFQVTRACTNHPSNNHGKARLRDGAEILVLFPHLCTRIWVHDWPDKKAIVDLPITLEGNSKHVTSNSLSPCRRCFSDVTNRGYIMSAKQANLLVHKCQKTSSPDSRCSFFFLSMQKSPSARPTPEAVMVGSVWPFVYQLRSQNRCCCCCYFLISLSLFLCEC